MKKEIKDQVFQIRMTQYEKGILKWLADNAGVSIAQLIRSIAIRVATQQLVRSIDDWLVDHEDEYTSQEYLDQLKRGLELIEKEQDRGGPFSRDGVLGLMHSEYLKSRLERAIAKANGEEAIYDDAKRDEDIDRLRVNEDTDIYKKWQERNDAKKEAHNRLWERWADEGFDMARIKYEKTLVIRKARKAAEELLKGENEKTT